jgi:hypothetical protein
MIKKLTTEIEQIRFVKPGDEKEGDEVIEGAERERFRTHFLTNIARIEAEFASYREMGPSDERTVCVRRVEKYEPPTQENKKP